MTQRRKATIVFQWNWAAIHAKNPDGSQKYRYIINEGASRSSKTRSTIQVYWYYSIENQIKRLTVWRHEKKLCKDTVGYDMSQIYPTMPNYRRSMFNKTESIYTFESGSTIEICGTDDAEKVMGYNQNVSWLNEPYSISRDTFDQIDQRTEDFIIIDWNPKQAHWIDDLKKNPRAIVIKSTFRHNPFCPPEQKKKILSYQTLSQFSGVVNKKLTEQEARIYSFSENKLGLSEKELAELLRCQENERIGTANKFNWSVYGLGEKSEKPNRIFFWTEIPDSEYHSIDAVKYYGVDWGTVDPWGILEAKYYDGALYFHEKNYRSENEIRGTLLPEEHELINQDGEGLVKWVFNKLEIDKKSNIICDTNRPLKITALWDMGYDYTTSAPKPPGSIIDGINLMNGLKCYFTSSSHNLKNEQENYSRKVDRYGVVEEEPEDMNNHLLDCSRYIALWLLLNGIISQR